MDVSNDSGVIVVAGRGRRDGGGVDDAQDDEMTTYTHTEPAMCKTPHGCSPMFRKCFCQPACTGCPVLAHKTEVSADVTEADILGEPRKDRSATDPEGTLFLIRGARHIKWTRNTVDPQRCKTEQKSGPDMHYTCHAILSELVAGVNGRNNVRILLQCSIST